MKLLAILAFSTGAVLCAPAGAFAQPSSPSPAASASPASADDPATAAAARSFYAQMASGKIDRAHVSDTLNNALPDPLLKTVSQQLTALGPPTWEFLTRKDSPNGAVSVYKLTYKNPPVLYYYFGRTPAGTVYGAFIGKDPPTH
jgi:membrane-bound lytic murein transglycosylase B